jgi:hypothetical protein
MEGNAQLAHARIRTMRISSALIGFIAVIGSAAAQSTKESTNTTCIERLEIPRYPALADSARLSASVTASVQLNTDGTVQAIVSEVSGVRDSVKAVFIKSIEDSLHSSAFLRSCGGHTVTLIFQFSLGEQTGTQQFVFAYPNRFTVLAPVMVVDHVPLRKHGHGKS